MPPFLAGLGWVSQAPAGNRLRWSVDFEEEASGRFLGLPSRVVLERAMHRNEPFPDTSVLDDPSNAAPASWWEDLGDRPVALPFPPRVVLPKRVQAVRFQYQGPETSMRVYDDEGNLVFARWVQPLEQVRLDASFIRVLEFFAAPATLLSVRVLDLFAAAHAVGLAFETIAVLAPRATAEISQAEAWQRHTLPATIESEDWEEYRRQVLPEALASTPASVSRNERIATPWQQVEWLIAARWEYAVVHGMGFLDGPDAGPGASADRIEQGALLKAMGDQIAVYRVTCSFPGRRETRGSNLMPIGPLEAPPLVAPVNLEYLRPEVRLFGADTYTVTTRQRWQVPDRRAIGVEIEEQAGSSPILKSAPFVNEIVFRTRAVSDTYPSMSLARRFDVPFYDVPLRFRARSIDGWDRTSALSVWSAQVTPTFIHNPAPPPLHSARYADDGTTLIPRTPAYTLEEWTADHAVANTPGSRLEVMYRTAEPEVRAVTIGAPKLHAETADDGQLRFYAVPVPAAVAQPEIFLGGSLTAGATRAEILAVEDGQFVFESIADSAGTAPLFEAGPATLQQAPNHPDLFSAVTSVAVSGLAGLLTFPHALPPPAGKTAVEFYAWRVRMGALLGAISNVAPVLRTPPSPDAPPPFSVELLGVDFYDRTLIRVELTEQVPSGRFSIFWARGAHDAGSFGEAAAIGDHGGQPLHHHRFLYETLPLPIPKSNEATVTFGLRAETEGGFKSSFTLLHFNIPPYGG